MNWKSAIRAARGFFYRRLPDGVVRFWPKRLAGFERRWGLESAGTTAEGFFAILKKKMLGRVVPGTFLELSAGDGLVGSLGAWLEKEASGWRVEGRDPRPFPGLCYRKNRPHANFQAGKLTTWPHGEKGPGPVGITCRSSREASGVCRAIREGRIRPGFLGLWNPTRRIVWNRRLSRVGYRLAVVKDRMEFYTNAQSDHGNPPQQVPDRGRS